MHQFLFSKHPPCCHVEVRVEAGRPVDYGTLTKAWGGLWQCSKAGEGLAEWGRLRLQAVMLT